MTKKNQRIAQRLAFVLRPELRTDAGLKIWRVLLKVLRQK